MLFKNEKNKKACHKYYTTWLIRIIALVIAFLFFKYCALATKTQEIEFKEAGGAYDGALVITRDSSGFLVITTPSGTVKIKDGLIILSGNIQIVGANIGTTLDPNLFVLSTDHIRFNAATRTLGAADFGEAGALGRVRVNDNTGAPVIDLDGTAGDATIKGGFNLGTSTGAPTGAFSLSDEIFLQNSQGIWWRNNADSAWIRGMLTYSDDNIFFGSGGNPSSVNMIFSLNAGNVMTFSGASGDVTMLSNLTTPESITAETGFNAGTATGAGPGDMKASDDIIAEDELEGKTVQLQIQTSSLPPPSATYAGMLWHDEDIGDSDRGKLYICLRTGGTLNYTWVLIAQGL
jgi:hypothetical protein